MVTSFAFAVISRKEVYLFRDGFTNMVSNWNNDMVVDLTLQSSPVLPTPAENYYVTEWGSVWPGNTEGCYCRDYDLNRNVVQGFKARSCILNETSSRFCDAIPETGPQPMKKWQNSQTIYAIRAKGTSFYENYLKIKSDGSCAAEYRQCGNKNSKSAGLCIPDKFTTCPLTDIQNTQPGGYNSLPLSSTTLYYSNTNKYNPVCDLVFSQEHTCFIRAHYALSPGRKRYELLKGDFTSCIKDPTVWTLAEMGELDLLEVNGLNPKKLHTFDTSNEWKWKLMAGRFIEWNPSCQDTVPSIVDKTADLDGLANSFIVLFVLYIISFVLGVIALGAKLCHMIERNTREYKGLLIARIASFILVAPSLIICAVKVNQFLSFFKNISELGCSNDETNQIFEQIAVNFKSSIVTKTVIFLVLGYIGFLFDIIGGIVVLNCDVLSYGIVHNSWEPSTKMDSQKQTPTAAMESSVSKPVIGSDIVRENAKGEGFSHLGTPFKKQEEELSLKQPAEAVPKNSYSK